MSPHRDFDAARAERLRNTEPTTFTFGGETFQVIVDPALGDVLALADAPEVEDNEVAAVKAILAFTAELVIPEHRARWVRMVRKQRPRWWRKRGIGFGTEDVIALGYWLVGVYTGRPTEPSTESSGGRGRSGDDTSSPTTTAPVDDSPTAT